MSQDMLDHWARFYHEVFGFTLDTKTVKMPVGYQEGISALLVVAYGLTLNLAWDTTIRLLGKTWKWWAGQQTIEDVHPAEKQAHIQTTGSYAIWHRGGREVDQETRNISTEKSEVMDLMSLTILERLIFGLFYFWERGEHIDTTSVTLCVGSRNSNGRVPDVFFSARRGVCVRGWVVVPRNPAFGVRVVVR